MLSDVTDHDASAFLVEVKVDPGARVWRSDPELDVRPQHDLLALVPPQVVPSVLGPGRVGDIRREVQASLGEGLPESLRKLIRGVAASDVVQMS